VTSLVYVYAVLDGPLPVKVVGIDERLVRWVSERELTAAVSDVPAAEFDEEPLNEGLQNMSWLGPRAVAHQAVNARLHAAASSLVPLAFGTVFRDDQRVRQMLLTDQASVLGERLAAVRGRAEWVVALHQLREPDAEYVVQASPALQSLASEIETSTPGRAHLLRRRLAELERDETRRLRADAAEQVLASLREVAADVYVEPLPSDTVERPLLRASVLVGRDDETRFVDVVDALRSRWPEPLYRVSLTGPWPAYRFGGLRREQPDV
jgi:gas vesicle protein GvpL/GvpF